MDEDEFSHRLEKKAERESGALLFWVFFISIFVGLYSSLFLVSRKDVVQTATPPPVINYQGKLLRDGASVTTAQNMGFLLFDASTNGNLLYTAAGTLAATTVAHRLAGASEHRERNLGHLLGGSGHGQYQLDSNFDFCQQPHTLP